MKALAVAALTAALVVMTRPAAAHPAPFTYLDLRLQDGALDVTLVAHIFDVGHDLHIDPSDRLLESGTLAAQNDAIVALLSSRLTILANGMPLSAGPWSRVEAVPDRQGLRMATHYMLPPNTGTVAVNARLFPYDPAHQTFVNVYEGAELTLQAILDSGKTELEYFPGSRQGMAALARRFAPVGAEHVLLGPDHLIFLVGLLVLGGSIRTLALVMGAFAGANLLALVLTLFNVLHPPPRIIEPALALSIVYIGADNLMVRGGRDMRIWIAAAFGLIHGFWFANGLRASDLPARTIGWSLLFFDVGVEMGHLLAIAAIGFAVIWLRARHEELGRRFAYAASILVIVAGTYWFVQRVFFPGGLA